MSFKRTQSLTLYYFLIMKKQYYLAAFLSIGMLTACSDDEVKTDNPSPSPEPSELPDWYYTGGELAKSGTVRTP